jgi:tetratricopeptide (TPR) repeat protein
LASKASPEAHYALGCLYYQLSRDSLAARHLNKALELDEQYSEALYVLGLISERAGHASIAEGYFARAKSRHVFRAAISSKAGRANIPPPAPLFRLTGNSRKLVTGGDRRLAEVLREDALNACSVADLDGR